MSIELTRMAIWRLRQTWEREWPMPEKLAAFAETVAGFGGVDEILGLLTGKCIAEAAPPIYAESPSRRGEPFDAVSF